MRRWQPDRKPGKRCRVCEHPEARTIDGALWAGQSPKAISRRYAPHLTKRHIAQHRDICIRQRVRAAFEKAGIGPGEGTS